MSLLSHPSSPKPVAFTKLNSEAASDGDREIIIWILGEIELILFLSPGRNS